MSKTVWTVLLPVICLEAETGVCGSPVALDPATTKPGYLARLLINETSFPGERGWIGEEDTRAAMLAILWVLHDRIHCVPSGYRQEQIAATESKDIIDVVTAGGERGQCDGFYRNEAGQFVTVPRVQQRIDALIQIANRREPGRFARLIIYAQGLATAYFADGIAGADRYANLEWIDAIPVTGRAYSWMADNDYYQPGGDFVKIPNSDEGSLGGNRFFTLRKYP